MALGSSRPGFVPLSPTCYLMVQSLSPDSGLLQVLACEMGAGLCVLRVTVRIK